MTRVAGILILSFFIIIGIYYVSRSLFDNPRLLLIIIIQGIICGIFTGFVAGEKGYSTWIWFACGLFFSIIALIAAAGLPMKQ